MNDYKLLIVVAVSYGAVVLLWLFHGVWTRYLKSLDQRDRDNNGPLQPG